MLSIRKGKARHSTSKNNTLDERTLMSDFELSDQLLKEFEEQKYHREALENEVEVLKQENKNLKKSIEEMVARDKK